MECPIERQSKYHSHRKEMCSITALSTNILSINSAHFVSTISSETILDNEIMVSFDVESLFTNVPIGAAVEAALQKLENDPNLADRTTLTPAQIADLLNFVLRSMYFSITDQFTNGKAQPWEVRSPLLLLTSTWRVLKNNSYFTIQA